MDEDKNPALLLKYSKVLLQDKLPVGAKECAKANVYFHEVKHVFSHLNDFIETFSDSSLSKSEIIAKLCELVVGFGLVNVLVVQDRDFNSDDFPFTAKYAENSSELLKVILNFFPHLESTFKCQIVVNILLLCGTHNQQYAWSNEKSVTMSTDLLKLLLEVTKQSDLMSLLCTEDFNSTIFKRLLKKLRPSLMKDNWLLSPSSCHVFSWFLHHVKHPYLSEYLYDIFPPPCMFVSSFQRSHRVLAIKCFDHILDNVPPTLIKIDGKDDVIHHLLLPHASSKEADIVALLYPCLLKLPSFQNQKMAEIAWTEYDHILEKLLFKTESCDEKNLTLLYLTHIYSYIKVAPPLKHLKHLVNVVGGCLSNFRDPDYHFPAMKIFIEVIKSCWPSMERYCFSILNNVLICLSYYEEKHYESSEEALTEMDRLSEECFTLLQQASKEKFQKIVKNYVEQPQNSGVNVIMRVLQKKEVS